MSSAGKRQRPFWRTPICAQVLDLVSTAFFLEAFLNHLGEQVISHWAEIERASPRRKLSALLRELGLEPDFDKRPYQSFNTIFDFRNFMTTVIFLSRSSIGRSGRSYAYYGITGNHPALSRFYRGAERVWRQWLDRRSHRARMTWERFFRLKRRYPLLPPRVVHSVYRLPSSPPPPSSAPRPGGVAVVSPAARVIRGQTSFAVSSMERRARAGSTQS